MAADYDPTLTYKQNKKNLVAAKNSIMSYLRVLRTRAARAAVIAGAPAPAPVAPGAPRASRVRSRLSAPAARSSPPRMALPPSPPRASGKRVARDQGSSRPTTAAKAPRFARPDLLLGPAPRPANQDEAGPSNYFDAGPSDDYGDGGFDFKHSPPRQSSGRSSRSGTPRSSTSSSSITSAASRARLGNPKTYGRNPAAAARAAERAAAIARLDAESEYYGKQNISVPDSRAPEQKEPGIRMLMSAQQVGAAANQADPVSNAQQAAARFLAEAGTGARRGRAARVLPAAPAAAASAVKPKKKLTRAQIAAGLGSRKKKSRLGRGFNPLDFFF